MTVSSHHLDESSEKRPDSVAYCGSGTGFLSIDGRWGDHQGILELGHDENSKRYDAKHLKLTNCLFVHKAISEISGSRALQTIFAWSPLHRLPSDLLPAILCIIAIQETLATLLLDTVAMEDPALERSSWYLSHALSVKRCRKLRRQLWDLGKPQGNWQPTNFAPPFSSIDLCH
jgi:hypothetical protein